MPNTLCDLDETDAAGRVKPVSTPVRLHFPTAIEAPACDICNHFPGGNRKKQNQNKTKKTYLGQGGGGEVCAAWACFCGETCCSCAVLTFSAGAE